MRQEPPERHDPTAVLPSVMARNPARLRLGIGSRLALGLAAVAAVILIGQGLATQTTRQAVQSLRSMQFEHEPQARRAQAVSDKLAAYDRAVIEFLQGDHQPAGDAIGDAGDELDRAVNHYFNDAPAPQMTAAALQLRIELAHHIAEGARLAGSAAKRTEWLQRRHLLLDAEQSRIAGAGGTGLAIVDEQVVLRRSLAELATALNAIR